MQREYAGARTGLHCQECFTKHMPGCIIAAVCLTHFQAQAWQAQRTCPIAVSSWGSGRRGHCRRRGVQARPPGGSGHQGREPLLCTAWPAQSVSPFQSIPATAQTKLFIRNFFHGRVGRSLNQTETRPSQTADANQYINCPKTQYEIQLCQGEKCSRAYSRIYAPTVAQHHGSACPQ